MTRLTYSEAENDSRFHDVESGEYIDPGQTVDVPEDRVDEFLNHDFATFERASDESESADVTAQADTDRATDAEAEQAPFDPGEYTIAELEDELDDRDLSDDELDALDRTERSGEDRDGAVEAIDDQRGG